MEWLRYAVDNKKLMQSVGCGAIVDTILLYSQPATSVYRGISFDYHFGLDQKVINFY